MPLHDIIKTVVSERGSEFVLAKGFVSLLADYGAFQSYDDSVYKEILRAAASDGSINKFIGRGKWASVSEKIVQEVAQRNSFDEDKTLYVFESIAYGLSWTKCAPLTPEEIHRNNEELIDEHHAELESTLAKFKEVESILKQWASEVKSMSETYDISILHEGWKEQSDKFLLTFRKWHQLLQSVNTQDGSEEIFYDQLDSLGRVLDPFLKDLKEQYDRCKLRAIEEKTRQREEELQQAKALIEQHKEKIITEGYEHVAREEAEQQSFIAERAAKKGFKKWLFIPIAIVALFVLQYFLLSPNTFKNDLEKFGVANGDTMRQGKKEYTINGVSFYMVKIDGGTFQMGATLEQKTPDDDEFPVHSVSLSDFYIGETEVTQALWTAVMGSNPSQHQGDNLPVECVSWYDCQEFIRKINHLTGQQFRLPTEAEWEFAARGGNKSRGFQYSGSDNLGEVAWYEANSGMHIHTVKTKRANELGLYDMSGNVWEWCYDRKDSYSSLPQTNPKGSSSLDAECINRGGGNGSKERLCHISLRNQYKPDRRKNFLGLRLAL